MLDLITFCKKIEPFVIYYKRLIKSYNNTAHNIMKIEIDLIFPQVPRKQKCGIITTLVSQIHRKRLIKSYNNTAHNIMKNKIDLIFPQVPRKQKCGIITTLVSQLHRISL